MPFEKGKSGNPDKMFTKENQPVNKGRKGTPTSYYLKELGNAYEVSYHIEIKTHSKKPEIKAGTIKSQSELNLILATLLWMDAIEGNYKAIKEILDRVEGKPMQSHTVGGDPDNPIKQEISIEIKR